MWTRNSGRATTGISRKKALAARFHLTPTQRPWSKRRRPSSRTNEEPDQLAAKKNGVPNSRFTPAELRKMRSLKNPYGIQKFLDDMPYHLEDTAWSRRKVLARRNARSPGRAAFAA